MANIVKLDQHTANLIAAGEVIERAASVVKELVENSIDAGATVIAVRLTDAGLTEITVNDNGCGMDAADARLCVEPHATSKIHDGKDLFRIHTLGFRGEALPSIVAVSNFKLKTSIDGIRGMMYSLKGGEFVSEATIGFPKGTEVIVKNLFFNTPARLQNLQPQGTELSYIVDLMTKMALSHPDIAFKLTNNDRVLMQTYGNNRLLEVIMNTYDEETAMNMIELFENNGYFKLSGFISKTNISRASKNNINIIVNGRSVRNYKIVNAVLEGYKGRYVSGRYPICVLNISVDPSLVDVNIHPTKQEVRFSNEEELLELIKKSISTTLAQINMIAEGSQKIDLEKDEDEEPAPLSKQTEALKPSYEQKLSDLPAESKKPSTSEAPVAEASVSDNVREPDPIIKGLNIDDFAADRKTSVIYHQKESKPEPEIKETYEQQEYSLNDDDSASDGLETANKLPKLYFIGQLHGTYLLFQDPDNFYLIDQHAAYERINYEKIHRELASDQVIVNEMLVPINLKFTPAEGYLISEKLPEFKKMGMIMEEFGTGTYVLRQVPLWFPKGKEKEYAEEVISKVISNRDADRYAMQDDLAKTLACKHSIKANQFLDAKSIDYLLRDLGKCENPYNCPHGRPVIVRFPITDIEKWFKRIV